MNLDIQPVILEFLSRRKSVDLPGLGRLYWQTNPAQKGETHAQLKSPTIELAFSQSSDSGEDLAQYLSQTCEVSPQQAQAGLVNWIQDIHNGINTQGSYTIDTLGRFEKNKDDLIFVSDQGLFNASMTLPDFIIQPVDRAYQAPTPILANGENGNGNGHWLNFLTNYVIPAILIALILLLSYFIYRQLNPQPQAGQQPVVQDSLQSDSVDNRETNGIVLDSVQYQNDSSWQEEALQNGEEESRLADFENRSCIIIVGSFKNMDNAEGMMRKVEELGWTLHSEKFGEYTRVGVKFDCYTKDLYRTLFQLRGKFSEAAWILKYKS